jgi:hypothetical protein
MKLGVKDRENRQKFKIKPYEENILELTKTLF